MFVALTLAGIRRRFSGSQTAGRGVCFCGRWRRVDVPLGSHRREHAWSLSFL